MGIRRIFNYSYQDATDMTPLLQGLDLDVVVDLGAGKRDSPISSQIANLVCNKLISVEKFEPYYPYLLGATSALSHEIQQVDILDFIFPSCDIVFLIDVIEHLTKRDALSLIQVMKANSKMIVIFTPEGDTIGYSNYDMDNALQMHKSAWEAEEFDKLGFDVTVYENFHTHIKSKPVGAIWAVWKE